MKRKLFSLLLSAFAVLLLMGAGNEPEAAALTVLMDEDSATPASVVQTLEESAAPALAATGTALHEAEVVTGDRTLLIDGIPASLETNKTTVDGVAYVSLKAMTLALNETAQVTWNPASATATVTAPNLNLTAQRGNIYLEANGRYLYVPGGLRVADGSLVAPLQAVCKAFDAQVRWDAGTGVIHVTRGSGAILPGDAFYNQDDLFWMSRIIQAESGGEPMEGKMAVGIVVLNRVKHPAFPNTILDVLAQKNQFTPYQNGKLASRTPNVSSVIAAKLVLDGGVVAEVATATYFDSAPNSWASRNKTCIAVIGGHKFYA